MSAERARGSDDLAGAAPADGPLEGRAPAGGTHADGPLDGGAPADDPLAGLEIDDCTTEQVVERARRLVVPGRRRILGLTGSPGAGKSTVAAAIVRALGPATAVLVPMDGFHLANVVLDTLGRRDRKGAHDTFDDAGYAALMERLHAADPDVTVYAPDFRRDLEEPIGSAIPVAPDVPLVVTEGNYLLLDRDRWPRARAFVDEVWFLAPDEEVRQDRLIRRHEAFGRSPDAARQWALGTDQRNADLIVGTAARADAVLRVR